MKESLNSIHPEDYHNVVYPQVCSNDLVGQFTIEGNIIFLPNPEKYPSFIETPQIEASKTQRQPLQGEFILTRKWDNKIFKLA